MTSLQILFVQILFVADRISGVRASLNPRSELRRSQANEDQPLSRRAESPVYPESGFPAKAGQLLPVDASGYSTSEEKSYIATAWLKGRVRPIVTEEQGIWFS
jgi:hypothetical protein